MHPQNGTEPMSIDVEPVLDEKQATEDDVAVIQPDVGPEEEAVISAPLRADDRMSIPRGVSD
jgi:hypothetical protein